MRSRPRRRPPGDDADDGRRGRHLEYGEAGPRPAGSVMTVAFELDPETAQRVMAAMLEMKKIDVDALEHAAGARA